MIIMTQAMQPYQWYYLFPTSLICGVGMLTMLEGTCTESALDSPRLLCKSFPSLASSRELEEGISLYPFLGCLKPWSLFKQKENKLGIINTKVALRTRVC
jgi:hypothetical protein